MASNLFPYIWQAKRLRVWAKPASMNYQPCTNMQKPLLTIYSKSHISYVFKIICLTIQSCNIHSHKALDHDAAPHSLHNALKDFLNNCTLMDFLSSGTGFLDEDASLRNPSLVKPFMLNENCQLRNSMKQSCGKTFHLFSLRTFKKSLKSKRKHKKTNKKVIK